MADETKQVDVILGPYRDHRLTMSAADADAAINAHWAREPNQAIDPDHEPHPPLTDQQRTDAMTAANTWAHATWDAAQNPQPPEPPPEGGVTHRAMKPEEAQGYKTRQAEPKHEQPKQEPPKR